MVCLHHPTTCAGKKHHDAYMCSADVCARTLHIYTPPHRCKLQTASLREKKIHFFLDQHFTVMYKLKQTWPKKKKKTSQTSV